MKVRKLAVALALVGTVGIGTVVPTSAWAVGDYDDGQAHPFRILAYVLHPVGYVAEWLITRPLHRIVSQDDLAPVFGYTARNGFDYETYTEGLSTGVSYGYPELGTRGYRRLHENPGIGSRRPTE